MTQTSENVTWLTQEAYDRLTSELDHLSGPGRVEIAKKIEEARLEGDLRENAGYHAAKDEQGHREARILQLRQLLLNAKVGEAPADSDTVQPGMVVTVRFADGDTETFLLGTRESSGGDDLEVYSPQSPLGTAISGHKAGDKVSYELPNGRQVAVEIAAAKPYGA